MSDGKYILDMIKSDIPLEKSDVDFDKIDWYKTKPQPLQREPNNQEIMDELKDIKQMLKLIFGVMF